MSDLLKFGIGNSKLGSHILTFSLPAGYACPFAKECHSRADKLTGKIIDGEHCRFRCYSATQEIVYPNVRKQRWHNFDLLRNTKGKSNKLTNLISNSIKEDSNIIRVHVSGDFYSESYFISWLNIALNNPNKIFYGYTKALPYLIKYKSDIPDNFRFVASKGGTHDHLIYRHGLRFAEVVFSLEDAKDKGLLIDHDDSLAIYGNDSFALLLHSTQPAGSDAAKALSKLRKLNIGGYSNKNKNKPKTIISVPIIKIKPKHNKKHSIID